MSRTSKTFAVGMLSAALALAVQAAAGPASLRNANDATRVVRGNGNALTAPSSAGGSAVVATWLRGKGLGSAANAMRTVSDKPDRKGIRQLRLKQEVGGLQVYGAYAKAAVGKRGELLSIIENFVAVPATGLKTASINEATALQAAFTKLALKDKVPGVVSRTGAVTQFAKGKGFVENPSVTRVAVPLSDGSLQVGFLVETWRTAGNSLVETLVGGDGRVLDVVNRTASDTYNVFTVSPDVTPQAPVTGDPAWLFNGAHRTIDIAGNNVHAYLDAVNDSIPDPGGTNVSNRTFTATFDPDVQPSTPENREVAVQNLFYTNNVIHDRLYLAGFDEAAGNFQEDNFGLGGKGGDSVNAEAQDGGGTDNANFATPNDGRNPRMQMYLWSSPEPDHQVVINSPISATYPARRAAFSPVITPTGLTGNIVLASDGAGANATDGCEAITTNVSNSIALVDRGNCDFVVKAQNALNAGATALIVANTQGDNPIVMGGASPSIPAVMIGQTNGAALKALAAPNGTIRAIDPPLIRRDGDVDSDIVWHEYGHGLTWRMIDRMQGPLSGAIGEGMADTLAIIVNDNPAVAEYSTGTPNGLRTAPYDNYTRTYGDILGASVHFDGEIYGAIGWRLWKNFQAVGASADSVLAILVDGMNYTKSMPAYEDMRDGILAPLRSQADRCRVWEAFAHYGVGVGARGKFEGNKVDIVESFALPAECQPAN
jgi:extracellular elastinolytic metalloproteinase